MGLGKQLLYVFGGLFVISGITGKIYQSTLPPPPAKTAAQIKVERKAERLDTVDVLRMRAVRDAMREPESFEVVRAIRLKNGTLCIRYRGRNGFGGMNVEHAVVGASVSRAAASAEIWNAHCANKTGLAVTKLRDWM